MTRWSKLQKEIEMLFAEGLGLRIHCGVYRMDSQWGSTNLPRYWITLGKEVIWDYPRDFKTSTERYPYVTDASAISELVREYVDTPVAELLTRQFEDHWHLVEILLAADRRIGQGKLKLLNERLQHPAALAVLRAR